MTHPEPWPIEKYVDIETVRYYKLCLEMFGVLPSTDKGGGEVVPEHHRPQEQGMAEKLQRPVTPLAPRQLSHVEPENTDERGRLMGMKSLRHLREEAVSAPYKLSDGEKKLVEKVGMLGEVDFSLAEMMHSVHVKGRDNVRTPMPVLRPLPKDIY